MFQVLLEYSGGQNLDIYLTRKTLSMDALHSYTQELLEGLEYLHNKDVTHKNLRVCKTVTNEFSILFA